MTVHPSGKSCLVCHVGAVANFDLDGHRVRRKPEIPSSEAKIVRIGAQRRKNSPSRPVKGANGLSSFELDEKIEQWIRISASRYRAFERALSSRDLSSKKSCDNHLKTPPLKNDEIGQMDNRSQAR